MPDEIGHGLHVSGATRNSETSEPLSPGSQKKKSKVTPGGAPSIEQRSWTGSSILMGLYVKPRPS